MGYTLYDGTLVVVQSLLTTLSHVLHQAEERPDSSTLLEARLFEDMLPLADQVRISTQYSENMVSKLTGVEAVVFDGDFATFAKCYARIEAVLKKVNEADKDIVNQHGDLLVTTPLGPGKTVELSAATYANLIAFPNIYFHITTAYGILRKEGVPLGKRDFYTGLHPQILARSS
jgi:hypothetical protein